jgi:hypothetical protein
MNSFILWDYFLSSLLAVSFVFSVYSTLRVTDCVIALKAAPIKELCGCSLISLHYNRVNQEINVLTQPASCLTALYQSHRFIFPLWGERNQVHYYWSQYWPFDECGAVGGMSASGNRSTRAKLAPMPLRLPWPHPGRRGGRPATNRTT